MRVNERGAAIDRSGLPLMGCFFFAALLYFVLRASLDLVWNDSGSVALMLLHTPGFLDVTVKSLFADPIGVLASIFGALQGDGYRPLSALWSHVGVNLVGAGAIGQIWWVAFVALLQGATAAAVFAVARRLIDEAWLALLATGLALMTPPAVAAQWIVLAFSQNLVIFIICCGLLAYWKYIEADRRRWLYHLLLVFILYFGPFVREFVGILPVLLLWLEIGVRGRRLSAVTITAFLGLAHALFPTAIMKFLFFPSLPLESIFAIGSLGQQLHMGPSAISSSWLDYFRDLRWQVLPFALVLIAPSFSALAGVSLFLRGGDIYLLGTRARLPGWLPAVVFTFGIFVLGTWWLVRGAPLATDLVLLWLLLGLALVGLRIHPLLPAWLLISTLPFLRIFNQETHLLYAGVPAAIIVCGAFNNLWRAASQPRWLNRAFAFRLVLACVATLAAADQACNLIGSYRIAKSVNNAEHLVSAWLIKATPIGAKVLANAAHGLDFQLFSGGHVSTYWTSGGPDPSKMIETPEKLQTLLRTEASAAIYFLDIDYDFTARKIEFHSHRFLWGPAVEVQPVGRIHTVSIRYLVLDPLKLIAPRDYVSYLGPPDLIDDFYHGPARNGAPFTREFFAVYDLYRVTGRNAAGWVPGGPAQIVERGFRGFDLWQWGNRSFALPAVAQFRSTRELLRADRPAMCLAETAAAVKQRILLENCPTQEGYGETGSHQPAVALASHHGFQIFRTEDNFVALGPGSPQFDLTGLRRGDYRYKQWFEASTYGDLQFLIDALPDPVPRGWAWLVRTAQ